MLPCQVHNLIDLCFGNFKRKHAADAHTFRVNMHHYLRRFRMDLAEKTFEDMHDEFHRRVIIIQHKDFIHRGFVGLGPRFNRDAGLIVVANFRRLDRCFVLIRHIAFIRNS